MRTYKLLLLTLLLPGLANAGGFDFSSSKRGSTVAGFLKLGVGARAVSMGEAHSAMANDATALYWNPAAINRVGRRSLTFMHASYINQSLFNYAAYVQSLGPRNGWGVSVQQFSAGSIELLDDSGNQAGSFTPNDLALSLGYAHRIGSLSVGMTGKFIQSKVIDSAQTFAADAGVLFPPMLDDRLRLSLSGHNFGGKLKYDQKEEELPSSIRLGSSLRIFDQLQAAMDFGLPNDSKPFVAAGMEWNLSMTDSFALTGRAGYNSRAEVSAEQMSGLSFGLGMGFKKLTFDYAFLPFGKLGLIHRLSITRRF